MSEAMQAVNETDGWTLLAILGLTGITVLTRSFFMWSEEKMAIPEWFQRGLHYAPVAAMAAVIVPEIVMKNGTLIDSFSDARIYGADLVLHARRRVWDHPQRHGSLLAAPFVGRLVDCKPQPAHGKTQPSGPQGVARVMGAAQRLRQAK